jgi:DNA-binding winged helix-turn-helix (wHTH) protein/tetratricopeptide (TPR) repeat protein
MSGGTLIYRFGPFELDPANRQLFRGPSTRVPLSDQQFDILLDCVTHPGQLRSKATLMKAGWAHVSVSEDSLKQAMSRMRRVLAAGTGGIVWIQAVRGEGYRLVASVERGERTEIADEDEEIAFFRDFVLGRTDVLTLNRERIQLGRLRLAEILRRKPHYGAAHVYYAFASALAFEATRVDMTCDLDALALALRHAREGTRREPASGEAWSVLGFVLYLNGDIEKSAGAFHKALEIDPDNYQLLLRLGFSSWGEERLRAAHRVLELAPGLALAYWLIATVYIARGAFDKALERLAIGCPLQDAQASSGSLSAIGLYLLRGHVLAAVGRLDEAIEALMHELTFVGHGHLWGRECAANTWYLIGAIRHRQGHREAAESAWRQCLEIAPGHRAAAAALGRPLPELRPSDPRRTDDEIAQVVGLVRAGRLREAAPLYRKAVMTSRSPNGGWMLEVDAIIMPFAHPEIWADVVELVRQRAR